MAGGKEIYLNDRTLFRVPEFVGRRRKEFKRYRGVSALPKFC